MLVAKRIRRLSPLKAHLSIYYTAPPRPASSITAQHVLVRLHGQELQKVPRRAHDLPKPRRPLFKGLHSSQAPPNAPEAPVASAARPRKLNAQNPFVRDVERRLDPFTQLTELFPQLLELHGAIICDRQK